MLLSYTDESIDAFELIYLKLGSFQVESLKICTLLSKRIDILNLSIWRHWNWKAFKLDKLKLG